MELFWRKCLLFGCCLVLQGCQTCTIYDRSPGCSAQMIGAVLVAAPAMAVNSAAASQRQAAEKKKSWEEFTDLWQKVGQGDYDSAVTCARYCLYYYTAASDQSRWQLRRMSMQIVIDHDNGSKPASNHEAAALLASYAERIDPRDRNWMPAEKLKYAERAWQLYIEAEPDPSAGKFYNSDDNNLKKNIALARLQVQDPKKVMQSFDQCPKWIARTSDDDKRHLLSRCQDVYASYVQPDALRRDPYLNAKALVPPELLAQWRAQLGIQDIDVPSPSL